MLVTDLNQFLDLPQDTPSRARQLAGHLTNIVRAATAGDAGTVWETALPCRRRPGNRRCPGRMIVLRTETAAPIRWQCSVCAHSDHATLAASGDNLDKLIGFVAAEANNEPSRRRQQRLDAAFDALSGAAQVPGRLVTRWPCPSWTLRECSGGAPPGCPSTPATKSASSARSPGDTSRSSSGAPPGARASGRSGRLPDRAAALHRCRQVLDLVLARPQPSIPHL
jgi:hypothetical protein